jgi:Aspartyl-tRNA synthetase
VWITEFPMFEYSDTEGRYMAMHHPFTNPLPEHLDMMLGGNLKDCNAEAYDLVLNGVEIGGGSIRIHNPEVQEKVFRLLGLSEEQVRKSSASSSTPSSTALLRTAVSPSVSTAW